MAGNWDRTLCCVQDRADVGAEWGAVVRARRLQFGLRQDELAALAGVSVRSVHAVEASKPTVRLDVLVAVASSLGLPVSIGGADAAIGGEA
jgi:HTH-type transcriptional regulator/antitoxin HipB